MIYTTQGFLPEDQVTIRETVTQEDDDMKIIRADKYLADGTWVGNDIRIEIKRTMIEMGAETGSFH